MKAKIISAIFSFSILSFFSVKGQAGNADSLQPFQELVKIGSFYNRTPFDLKVHIEKTSILNANRKDTLKANLRLYCDSHQFYMKSEDVEEVGNDSVLLMLNNNARQIILYPNLQKMTGAKLRSTLTSIPDSTLSVISERYKGSLSKVREGINLIKIESRQTIHGTLLPKEMMTVEFHHDTHEPITMNQSRYSLVPIDSVSFFQWKVSPAYKDRLFETSTENGKIFFLLKEEKTSFRFVKISFEVKESPLKLADILQRQKNGEYVLVPKYNGYVFSSEL